LPEEQSAYIDKQVDSGTFGSASEVVRAGLRALQERDAVIERWLWNEVAPAFDEVRNDPGQLVSIDEVFAAVRSRHPDLAGEKA